MSQALAYALRYAELGWPVFPCPPREKRPATSNGHLDATTDPEQIQNWWAAMPDANVAIALPEDVVVVDIDDPGTLELMHHLDRDLPATVTSQTARGRHYWYGHGVEGAKATIRLPELPDVDIKGLGGYVLVPPSVHPSGEPYTWEVPPRPEHLALAPDWLVEALRDSSRPGVLLAEGGRVLRSKALAGVSEGERNDTLFRYACQLRARCVPRYEAEVLLTHAAAQCRPPLPAREVNKLLASAWRYRPGQKDDSESSNVQPMADLLAAEFPPMNWIVPNLICEGLTVIASAPKVGKSWIAMNLALAVGCGGFFLGYHHLEAGNVLYLDLEQPPRRTQARLRALPGPWEGDISFAHEWPTHDRGGFDALDDWISQHAGVRLVIIDVLQKVIGTKPRGGNSYEVDYRIYSDLKAIADRHGVGIVVLHHDRKTVSVSDDDLDRISGSRALVGAADGVMLLNRKRGESSGMLIATGREIEDQRIPIHWDAHTRVWVQTTLPGEDGPGLQQAIRRQVAGPVPT